MKFKAIITQSDGEQIILELSCREYHAKKLNYVLSRTLDRSVYLDAAVVACDAVQVDAAPARRTRNTRAPLLDLSTVEKICNQGGKR